MEVDGRTDKWEVGLEGGETTQPVKFDTCLHSAKKKKKMDSGNRRWESLQYVIGGQKKSTRHYVNVLAEQVLKLSNPPLAATYELKQNRTAHSSLDHNHPKKTKNTQSCLLSGHTSLEVCPT